MMISIHVYSQVNGKRMDIVSSNTDLPSLIKDKTYQGQAWQNQANRILLEEKDMSFDVNIWSTKFSYEDYFIFHVWEGVAKVISTSQKKNVKEC